MIALLDDDEAPADPLAPCVHENQETRLRTLSNGGKAIYRQCLACGSSTSNALPKSSLTPDQYAGLLPYDDSIKEQYDKARSEIARAHYLKAMGDRDDSKVVHTEEYHAYLLTPEWRDRRALVLKRANYTCEGCLKVPAEQVHHLTYKHIFHELLFELVALCEPCHKKCHPEKQ